MSSYPDVEMSDVRVRPRAPSLNITRQRRPSTASRASQKSPLIPRGFIAPPKSHERPLHTLSTRELWDRYEMNDKILRETPSSSLSTYTARMEAEQLQIQSRLNDLGVSSLNQVLDGVHITPSNTPNAAPRMIAAKRVALERFDLAHAGTKSILLPEPEAQAIQAKVNQHQDAKERRAWERRNITGKIMPGEQLSQKQMSERLWAFMHYKPTESDEEFDEEDDDDDDDDAPAMRNNSGKLETWFDDYDSDQGHDVVPDEELVGIIQVEQPGNYEVMKIEH